MLGRSVLGQLGGLEEGRLADLALDVHGLLVLDGGVSGGWPFAVRATGETYDFELRLRGLLILGVALALLLCLGSLVVLSAGFFLGTEKVTEKVGRGTLRYPWLRILTLNVGRGKYGYVVKLVAWRLRAETKFAGEKGGMELWLQRRPTWNFSGALLRRLDWTLGKKIGR